MMVLTCLWQVPLYAQQMRPISGTITDKETNEPLPGVNIRVVGTNKGTMTNLDGKYTIRAKKGDKLEFSYIGYKSIRSVVGDNNKVNTSLEVEAELLDEAVVIGYGVVKKSDMTGAVSGIRAGDILKVNPTSIQDALKGRVSGVQFVSNDGSPGGGMTIRIRGQNSLTAGSQPLFVIDGFPLAQDDDPTYNPLADINPSDIASVEILKDASATAIYGAAGANGVVMVTTKTGQEGKAKLNLSLNYGISEIPQERRIKVQSPEQYAQRRFDQTKYGSWARIIENGDYSESTNWLDLVTRVAHSKNANLSLSGGTKKLKYRISSVIDDEEGALIQSKFNRFSTRLNADYALRDNLTLKANISYGMTKYNGFLNDWSNENIVTKALFADPFMPVDYVVDPNITDEEGFDLTLYSENPYTYLNQVEKERINENIFGKADLIWKPIRGLQFRTSAGMTLRTMEDYRIRPSTTRAGGLVGGEIKYRTQEARNFVLLNQGSYNKKIGKHSFGVMVANEIKRNSVETLQQTAWQIQDIHLGKYALGNTTTPVPMQYGYREWTMLSYLGRVNYSFANKYLVTASIRADGSSIFGEGNKWGYFPSTAVAWKVNQEEFLKSIDKLTELKLRASYGMTGNNQIPTYSSQALYNNSNYVFGDGDVFAKVPAGMANPNLKWETSTQLDLGVDVGLFDDRITATVDWYYKKTTDLLLNVQVPRTSGFQTVYKNVGALENKGLDFDINTVNIDAGGFKWTTGFNISFNTNKILDLGDRQEMTFTSNIDKSKIKNDILLRVGQPIGVYQGYISDGVFQNEQDLAKGPYQLVAGNELGDARFIDVNGDGVISELDRVPLANTMPKHTGGFSNNFSYKNFNLYVLFRWSYGNDVVNGNLRWLTSTTQSFNNLASLADKYWSPENPENTYPALGTQAQHQLFRSELVEDGSFLRLDNVNLSYDLPRKLLGKHISNLKVYASASNLWVWTNYSWWDPEVNNTSGELSTTGPGLDIGSFPRTRTFKFGVNIGL